MFSFLPVQVMLHTRGGDSCNWWVLAEACSKCISVLRTLKPVQINIASEVVFAKMGLQLIQQMLFLFFFCWFFFFNMKTITGDPAGLNRTKCFSGITFILVPSITLILNKLSCSYCSLVQANIADCPNYFSKQSLRFEVGICHKQVSPFCSWSLGLCCYVRGGCSGSPSWV